MATEARIPFRMRRLRPLLAILLLLLPAAASEVASTPSEYQVKAVFLFNFAKFVTWPSEAFDSPTAPLLIGVLGEDPFEQELQRLAAELRVQGRDLHVVHGTNAAALAGCHVLFISASEDAQLAQILGTLRQMRSFALTVGEADGFLRLGGMIRFVVEEKKVRFEISPQSAGQAGLTISSKLLNLGLNARSRG